mgnify:CR=1 FL=1
MTSDKKAASVADGLLRQALSSRTVIADGAMGTMNQQYKLSEQDYRGLPGNSRFVDHPGDLKGNNELLVLTQPEIISKIHEQYLDAGADIIDCSSGQVSKKERPIYGRMFQTPFSDRIRNQANIATIAVGAIFEADNANTIIAAGRADLCAVARPHLANPAWILTEGAKSGYADVPWPKQYVAAKIQLERNLEREKQQAAAAKNAMSFEQITQIFGEV